MFLVINMLIVCQAGASSCFRFKVGHLQLYIASHLLPSLYYSPWSAVPPARGGQASSWAKWPGARTNLSGRTQTATLTSRRTLLRTLDKPDPIPTVFTARIIKTWVEPHSPFPPQDLKGWDARTMHLSPINCPNIITWKGTAAKQAVTNSYILGTGVSLAPWWSVQSRLPPLSKTLNSSHCSFAYGNLHIARIPVYETGLFKSYVVQVYNLWWMYTYMVTVLQHLIPVPMIS